MFKFSIRELLLVTAVVGVASGWWARERQLQAMLDEFGAVKQEALIWACKARLLEFATRDSGWTVGLNDGSGLLVRKPGETGKLYRWEKAPMPVSYWSPGATRQGS